MKKISIIALALLFSAGTIFADSESKLTSQLDIIQRALEQNSFQSLKPILLTTADLRGIVINQNIPDGLFEAASEKWFKESVEKMKSGYRIDKFAIKEVVFIKKGDKASRDIVGIEVDISFIRDTETVRNQIIFILIDGRWKLSLEK